MKVVVYREKAWWVLDPENKPTAWGFNEWKIYTPKLGSPKINMTRGIKNVTINTAIKNIYYLEIQHDDIVYYYYVKSVNLITVELYQYELELDLWTTYILPYIEKLKEKNASLKIKRATYLFDTITGLNINQQKIYDDPLMDDITPQYKQLKYLYQTNTIEQTINGTAVITSAGKHPNNWTISKRFAAEPFVQISTCEYYVFSTVDGKFIDCYPVISGTKQTGKIGWIENASLKNYKIYNNHPSALNQLKIDNEVRFKGIYILPSIMHWDMETNGEPFVGGGLSDLFGIRIDPQKPIINWIEHKLPFEIKQVADVKNKLNVKNVLLSPLIFKYFNFKLYNSDLFPSDFTDARSDDGDKKPKFGSNDGVYWKFTNKGIVYTGSEHSKIETIPKELTGQLPSISSSFDRFIIENQTSINAGLGLSILPIIASVLGVVVTAATGGIGAGVGAGIATASIASAVGGSTAKIGSTLSKIADAKNANQTTHNNTMSKDAFWSQGVVPQVDTVTVDKAGLVINYNEILNIADYNNIVVKYGYIINNRYNINDIFSYFQDGRKFCFVSFDVNQCFDEHKELLDFTPTNFIGEILEVLKNGIRFWNFHKLWWEYEN